MANNAFKYIAIIESPLQLMCFLELVYCMDISCDSCILVLNYNSAVSSDNKVIYNALLAKYSSNFKALVEVDLFASKSQVKDKWVYLLNKIDIYNLQNITAIVGEYRSYLSRAIVNSYNLADHVIILDDGNAIKRLPGLRYGIKNYFKRVLKKLIYSVRQVNFSEYSSLTIYSAFLNSEQVKKPDKYLKNEFLRLKKIISNQISEVACIESVVIIGSPLFEAGVVATEEIEDLLLDKLFDYIGQVFPGKNLLYVPHRRENIGKLRKLKENYKVEIDDSIEPAEFKVLKYGSAVVGFYSSVFELLPLIDKEVNIYAYKLPLDCIVEEWRGFVLSQYSDYMSRVNIEVVDERVRN